MFLGGLGFGKFRLRLRATSHHQTLPFSYCFVLGDSQETHTHIQEGPNQSVAATIYMCMH